MRIRNHFDEITQLRVKTESVRHLNSFLAIIILIHEERLSFC